MTDPGAAPEHRVWVYGSLMSTRSLVATLHHRVQPPPMRRGVLLGWRRAWNCLSAKTFLTPDQRRVRRVVAGLQRDRGAAIEGVLLDLTAHDMTLLREREQAYDEVDVTDALSPSERPAVTFVPRPTRTRGLMTSDLPLVVERNYFDLCVDGALQHDLDDAVEELQRALDLDLADAATDVRWEPLE